MKCVYIGANLESSSKCTADCSLIKTQRDRVRSRARVGGKKAKEGESYTCFTSLNPFPT